MKTKTARSTSNQKRSPTRKSAGAATSKRAAAPTATTKPARRVRTDCDFLRPIA